jgi:hypothetical protein
MFSVFTTILLAFAFSFHLAMRKHHVFDNAFTSFLKMINMMVGEYNFDENFTFEKGTKRSLKYYSKKNYKGLISAVKLCSKNYFPEMLRQIQKL